MPSTTRALRRNVLSMLVHASLAATLTALPALAGASACTVVTNADDPATASAAVTALTASGTLRDCILAANLLTGSTGAPTGSMTVTFDPAAFTGGAANTIVLGDSLPLIFNHTTIDASALTQPVVVDGGNAHRIFFVSGLPDSTQNFNATGLPDPDGAQAISATFKNLLLRNGKAQGGNGAGGGLGAGGALFVNKNATVTLSDVSFAANAALGGNGAASEQGIGGGGMGGDGSTDYGGGGLGGSGMFAGGGIGTDALDGIVGSFIIPGIAGGGFGGTRIGQTSSAQNFGAGFGGGQYKNRTFYAGGIGGGGSQGMNGGFGGGSGALNGIGGFGGGGGGKTKQAVDPSGFGGGGGSADKGKSGGTLNTFVYFGYNGYAGGAGGFGSGGGGGGGGGGCMNYKGSLGTPQGPPPGLGGAGGAGGIGGGAGAKGGDGTPCPVLYVTTAPGVNGMGGGGGGLGGAVFVRDGGALTLKSSAAARVSGNSVTAGSGIHNGAAAGAGLFLMSGAAITFDISGVYTISDGVADDSPVGLPAGQSYTAGTGSGLLVYKQGTGTLIVDGANAFAGVVAVGAGALGGNGDVPAGILLASGTTIAPGDPATGGGVGTLVTGPLVWTSGSTVQFQLGDTPTASDSLIINGALTKNGPGVPLRFHFGMGAKPPAVGQTFDVLITQDLSTLATTDFYYDFDATYSSLLGHFTVVGNSLTFSVDSLTSSRIFADGFD